MRFSAHLGLCLALLWSPAQVSAADSPVVEAVRAGNVDGLRALLGGGADVDSAAGDGSTALTWAAYRDDLAMVEVLIGSGADLDRANDLGVTALWAAGQNGNLAIVERLLAAGADPDIPLLSGESPLMVAARSGYAGIVERLLAAGADPDRKATRDQTALMWAAAEKHPDVVEVLLAYEADLFARSAVWSEVMAVPPHGYLGYNRDIPHGSDTALMFASREGALDSAKLLIEAGANPNDADAWGVSAVTLAAHSGYTDVVELLLDSGADPNAPGAGFTALHEAIMRRDERMARALLEHGADPNAPLETWTPTRRSSTDFNFAPELVGARPFWLAARFTAPGIMRLLVEHGADPLFVHRGSRAVATSEGEFEFRVEETTPLLAALGMGGGQAWVDAERDERDDLTFEAVKLAVELGVDVNADNNGRTALDAARGEQIVEFLTEHGARHGEGGAGRGRGGPRRGQ